MAGRLLQFSYVTLWRVILPISTLVVGPFRPLFYSGPFSRVHVNLVWDPFYSEGMRLVYPPIEVRRINEGGNPTALFILVFMVLAFAFGRIKGTGTRGIKGG